MCVWFSNYSISSRLHTDSKGAGLGLGSGSGARDARTERQRAAQKHAMRSDVCSCDGGFVSTCLVCCCKNNTRRLVSGLAVISIVVAVCVLVYYLVCWPDVSPWQNVSWNDRFISAQHIRTASLESESPPAGAGSVAFTRAHLAAAVAGSAHRNSPPPPSPAPAQVPAAHHKPAPVPAGAVITLRSEEPSTPPPVSTWTDAGATPPNTTIAYVGDTNLGARGEAVYDLIARHSSPVHAIVLVGDLDYHDNPKRWAQQLETKIPSDIPVIVAVGNHDSCKWPAYQKEIIRLMARSANSTGICEGVVGVHMTCVVRGMVFAVTAPGIFTADDFNYASYIDRAFTNPQLSGAIWKTCAWHKNQRAMQTGSKPDETGWSIYQTCLRHSALVMTGHEHSYSRTRPLSSFVEQQLISTADPASNSADAKLFTLSSTSGVAIVSGMGGESVRDGTTLNDHDLYWASTYNAGSDGAGSVVGGVVFCTYHIDGQPNKAACEFRVTTSDGVVSIIDSWIMYTAQP